MVAVLTDIDNPQACDATEMGVFDGGLVCCILFSMYFGFKRQRISENRFWKSVESAIAF